MRDEAKTWWLFSGPDVASSYFFKRKSVSHLNHEPSFGYRCYRQRLLSYSKNYGSLTHETRIKDAVYMEDLICLLATVRTLK